MNDPWIRLHSGKKFHFLNPKTEEIDIKDIAHNLSQQCRFTGATRVFYSIAEHCCRVCDILSEENKLEGLMHDSSESVAADLNSPLKSLLPQYKEIEIRIEKSMSKKFKLRFPFPSAIKVADMTMLVTEMKYLMPGKDYKNLPFTPLNEKIVPWSMKQAKSEFLKRYNKYKRK